LLVFSALDSPLPELAQADPGADREAVLAEKRDMERRHPETPFHIAFFILWSFL